jgi:CHAT domain-containing protein/tetratricopeptide (TPR) repeat protein
MNPMEILPRIPMGGEPRGFIQWEAARWIFRYLRATTAVVMIAMVCTPIALAGPPPDASASSFVNEIETAIDDVRLDDALSLAKKMSESIGSTARSKPRSLLMLANVQFARGDIDGSEGLFHEVIKSAPSSNGAVRAEALLGLSEIAALQGKTRAAGDLCKQASDRVKGKADAPVRLRIRLLWCGAASAENPNVSEHMLREALDIAQRAFGPLEPRTLPALMTLGDFFRAQGKLHEAGLLLMEAANAAALELGPSHPMTARACFILARLYQVQGNLAFAEGGFTQGVDEAQRLLGPNHPTTALARIELAALHSALGRYAEATAGLRLALGALRSTLGSNTPTVAVAEINLALAYLAMGMADLVDPLLAHAEDIMTRSTEMTITIRGIIDLTAGTLNRQRGSNDAAMVRLRKAHDAFTGNPGVNVLTVAGTRMELGRTELARGNAGEAVRWLESAVAQFKAVGAAPHLAVALGDLATVHLAAGDRATALAERCSANELREQLLNSALRLGSDGQRRLMVAQAQGEMSATFDFIGGHFSQDPAALRCAALALVRWRARALDASEAAVTLLKDHPTERSPTLLADLARARASLTHQTWYEPEGGVGIALASSNAQVFDAGVAIEASKVHGLYDSGGIALEDVLHKMPRGAIAVEFVKFLSRSSSRGQAGPSAALHYAGFLFDAEGIRAWHDVGESAAIDKIVEQFRATLRTPGAPELKGYARQLDELLLVPFEPALRRAGRIFVAPDGSLTLVPFAALIDHDGKYRAESSVISYVNSVRDVISWQEPSRAVGHAAFFGDPVLTNLPPGFGTPRRLRAAKLEVTAVQRTFPSVSVLLGSDATESAVKALHAPEVLHIATHGVFRAPRFPTTTAGFDAHPLDPSLTPKDERDAALYIADDPMLRSALVLSGSAAADGDDGLLSALEMSSLDLLGTKLVVLSACDTGVGAPAASEGVLGLRRALVLAGAQSQVLSLWQIDDEPTRRIMEDFYLEIGRGADPAAALRTAQLHMMATPGFEHPYFWAGLMASGAPLPIVQSHPHAEPAGPPKAAVGCGHCGVVEPSRPEYGLVLPLLLACSWVRRRGHAHSSQR